MKKSLMFAIFSFSLFGFGVKGADDEFVVELNILDRNKKITVNDARIRVSPNDYLVGDDSIINKYIAEKFLDVGDFQITDIIINYTRKVQPKDGMLEITRGVGALKKVVDEVPIKEATLGRLEIGNGAILSFIGYSPMWMKKAKEK